MVSDPLGVRTNTGDNTPAVLHTELVPGNRVEVSLAAKGGGSENKARFSVLNPSASLVDWIRCRHWGPAGARRASSASAWEEAPRRPCCWPRSP